MVIAIALLLFAAWLFFSSGLLNSQVDGIDRDLLNATKGDKALAKRLLEYARTRYPGKSEDWYIEKVLYDLQRDGACGYRTSTRRRSPRSNRLTWPKRFRL
ncbi:MAG: hypothetical protein MUF49_01285 [Oculatellaceae cyanobacterium Prado106]|jgi:hypothetical protein|nr:hypothetical protein [Oculatellaceae cyanobacterium Prado106]